MHEVRRPKFRIWVPGRPLSARKSKKSSTTYVSEIRNAAKAVVPAPRRSNRIDVEIFFEASGAMRADVDNIVKPILDALIGIVYFDDKQVRSVRATALPSDDAYILSGWTSGDALGRLSRNGPRQFLVDVYEGLATPGPGVDPKRVK